MNVEALLTNALSAIACAEIATAPEPLAPDLRPLRRYRKVVHVHRDPVSKRITHTTEETAEQPSEDVRDAILREYRGRFRRKDPTKSVTKLGPPSVIGTWEGQMYEIGPPVPLAKSGTWYIPPGTWIPESNPLYPILDHLGALEQDLEDLEECHARPELIKKAALALKYARRPR